MLKLCFISLLEFSLSSPVTSWSSLVSSTVSAFFSSLGCCVMARQELDLKVAFEEMEKDDRLQRVSYLRKEFAVAKAETEMVSLEEMMSCLEMTMMAETRVEMGMMYKDWHEDEEMEHLEMDRLLTDNDGAKDATEGEDDRVIDMELEHEYLDGVLEEWSQRMEVVEHIEPQYGGCDEARSEGLQDEDVELMGNAQEEVQEDAYVLGGMWYLNNWVLTSSMSEEHWEASDAIVGYGKSGQSFHLLRQNRNLEIGLVITQVG
jgi:hypothetical protein